MFVSPVRTIRQLAPSQLPGAARPALLLVVLAHIPLALAMREARPLVELHALVTICVSIAVAASGSRADRTAACAAYITGAEVLWRMTDDQLPWELGKYAIVLIMFVWMVRAGSLKSLILPGVTFCLLLPSAVLTFWDLDLAEARNQLSFNLSGPLALAVCAAFFTNVSLRPRDLGRILTMLVAPVCGIAAIVLFGILTTPNITFTTESNFALSGGFGPNQVSAALGLGVLCAFLLIIEKRTPLTFRVVMFALMVWLAAQSALTYSRGGLYTAGAGAVAAWLVLLKEPKQLIKPLIVAASLFVVGYYAIWPQLDEFTEGTLTQRFEDTNTTRRSGLGSADLDLWAEHPVMGVGPGVSKETHEDAIAAHTEFTRLVAEHGLFGAAFIAMMCVASVWNFRRAASSRERAIVVAMFVWSVLFMLNSAMRLVAPAFAFGLTFAAVLPVPAVVERLPVLLARRQPRLLSSTT